MHVHINFFAIGTPTVDFGFYQATPVFFTVDGNTACVVGVITHLQNLPPASEPRPLYTLFKVTDVPGGPDRFTAISFAFPIDPAFWCSVVTPSQQVTSGDFTITP